MMTRGIRGATTIEQDTEQQIWNATEKLVIEMAEVNGVVPDQISSIMISTTEDISAAFPARAVRSMEGWQFVPVMCFHEMNVPGAMPKCIRILMQVNTSAEQKEIQHIYQNEAVRLRPDLQV